jgi:hypothetical protein
VSAGEKRERVARVDAGTLHELQRHELLEKLAREQANTALARAEVMAKERALIVTRFFHAHGVPLAARVDAATGEITYPTEPPAEAPKAKA